MSNIIHGDCLEVMKAIPDNSIDMVLCDLPYGGVTACKWDIPIKLNLLWKQYKRIVKDRRAVVLTATQPFTSKLVMSNLEWFKYEWVWEKEQGTGFQLSRYRPLMKNESCLVFSENTPLYNPQKERLKKPKIKRRRSGVSSGSESTPMEYSDKRTSVYTHKTPDNILKFKRDNMGHNGSLHPTQKPVALFEYLIKTYSNEGDTIPDNCAGSGTTGIAAMNTGRNFILIEKEQKYIGIINKRINEWEF